MPKQITFNQESRDALKRGVDALANAVKVTLGARGRNVIIDKSGVSPHITKDGVTVAKNIELADRTENMGAQMIKEVAAKTGDIAGDGTTTATVLAQAIVTAGLKNVSAGANPMALKRGIDKAVKAIVKRLAEISHSVGEQQIEQVATVSANNDSEIGRLIADAMNKVGKTGVITVEEASGSETTVTVVEGMQFDRGYVSHFFATNTETLTCEYDNPFILLYDKKISIMRDIIPILEKVYKENRPLVIIAEDIDGEALSTLVINKMRGQLQVVAVKAPGFGDRRVAILEDIAVLTGGLLISETRGFKLENTDLNNLGSCRKVIIGKDSTLIMGGIGTQEEISMRTAQIKTQIASCTSDYEREKLQERLAKLSGGVAILNVGAATEMEMKEKKDRIDDALHATRAAVEEGIVPGGGVAYIRVLDALNFTGSNEDETTGINIVRKAIEEPLRQIVLNAGGEPSVVLGMVKTGTGDYGYNAETDMYENFFQTGIIDPTKVSRIALENAASIAGLLLTTECVLTEIEPSKN